MTEQPYSGQHCSPLQHEEGARKGALNIAYSTLPHLASRGWKGTLISGRNKNTNKLKRIPLTLGAWNVRTLLDTDTTNRPERRTALIAMELARYKVDIAALSETRLSGTGERCESASGYTFFWSGRPENERREAGVGFAIKSSLINRLSGPPKGINDRLMSLSISLSTGKTQLHIISAYAPTLTNPDGIKEKFYSDLHSTLSSIPKNDKLALLGDFNARVGSDSASWDGTIGKHGIGKCNSNGHLLLETCAEFNLLVTNTIFQLPTRYKTTWMHPRSKNWHQIDYVIVRSRDRQDVKITRAMCGAECWTDHRLLISKWNVAVKPKRRPQGAKPPQRLNVSKLKFDCYKEDLSVALQNCLPSVNFDSGNVETGWNNLKEAVYKAAFETLGRPTRKNKDWFDDNCAEIKELLEEKHRCLQAHISDPSSSVKHGAFKEIRNTVQRKLRTMQDVWLSNKADEIQGYADSHDSRKFYSAIREVYGPSTPGQSPLLSLDGKALITEKSQILQRWAEHFSSVLNRPSAINEEAINRLPQVPVDTSLDELPTLQETKDAIARLSNGKAAGSDAIPAEIYKEGGITLTEKLHQLLIVIWENATIPQEFKDANIVHLYKRKGNIQACDNHRGISLLSIAGKILARILLDRLVDHLDPGLLPESQCGFRKERGTTDMIFAIRQLQEKCQEQHRDLFLTFVDLTKAFDTVCREGLWKIMAKYGCPPKFITMVRQFHDGMQARVLDNGESSSPFPVSNGVKQGCVLAPTLFSIMFSAMLKDAYREGADGLNIKFRFDGGGVFNLNRLQAKTKSHHAMVSELLFADDCALTTGSEAEMQSSVNKFASACDNFGLTISTKKTEVLYQPSPGTSYKEPHVKVGDTELNAVASFTYLGSTIARNCTIDNEVDSRIAKASAAFGRLRHNVWDRKGIREDTKLKVYRAIVLPTLLYACETWTVYQRHAKRLNRFHQNCLRKILKIQWQDLTPDTEVLEKSGLPSIYTLLMKYQLRWAGHVARMPHSRIPKQLLYGELSEGQRSRGGQKKRFKDTLKSSLKAFDIDHDSWQVLSSDRDRWRQTVHDGASQAEQAQATKAAQARQARKERASRPVTSDNMLQCPHCQRQFRARIGLISHLRTHKPNQQTTI